MLKRTTIVITLLMAVCVSAFAGDLTNPKEIIKKSTDRMLAMKNFGFVIEKEGWDFNMEKTAEATKSLTGEASGSRLTKNLVKDVDQVDSTAPKWMTYKSEYKWAKPWVLWMKITQSDYVPSMLINGIMRYNYVKNKKNWSIKTPVVIVGIPRGIDTESGNFLFAGWHLNYMFLNNLAKDVEPVLEGKVKMDGKDVYKIGFHFSDAAKAKSHAKDTDFAAYGVPKELKFKYDAEIDWFVDEAARYKDVYYYIDAKTLDMVGEEVIQKNGELYYKKIWKNIRVDSLDKDEFK